MSLRTPNQPPILRYSRKLLQASVPNKPSGPSSKRETLGKTTIIANLKQTGDHKTWFKEGQYSSSYPITIAPRDKGAGTCCSIDNSNTSHITHPTPQGQCKIHPSPWI